MASRAKRITYGTYGAAGQQGGGAAGQGTSRGVRSAVSEESAVSGWDECRDPGGRGLSVTPQRQLLLACQARCHTTNAAAHLGLGVTPGGGCSGYVGLLSVRVSCGPRGPRLLKYLAVPEGMSQMTRRASITQFNLPLPEFYQSSEFRRERPPAVISVRRHTSPPPPRRDRRPTGYPRRLRPGPSLPL